MVCRAVTLRAGSVQGGGSREGRHGAALEPLAQRSDAFEGAHEFLVTVFVFDNVPTDRIGCEAATRPRGGMLEVFMGG